MVFHRASPIILLFWDPLLVLLAPPVFEYPSLDLNDNSRSHGLLLVSLSPVRRERKRAGHCSRAQHWIKTEIGLR